jgi:protein-L-isoaspartate(D-aspartate) O-methyltransferase
MNFTKQRLAMVRDHISARGIKDKALLTALSTVAREKFVPNHLVAMAYEDSPQPIGAGQTISQPYIVALMIQALQLKTGDRVLEVGTGSGYAAAILAEMGADVYTIERILKLSKRATNNLHDAGYDQVHVRQSDGTLGWTEESPFDAILVSAGGPSVPMSLRKQLKIGGRLVMPVGPKRTSQRLIQLTRRTETDYDERDITGVRFVPLIGFEGW